jgi:hypothetical protein
MRVTIASTANIMFVMKTPAHIPQRGSLQTSYQLIYQRFLATPPGFEPAGVTSW